MTISGLKIVNEENENLVASRRNELMLAPFRLSLWAQRLFLYVISQVKDGDPVDHRYTFPVAHLAKTVGVENPNLYRGMLEIIDELEVAKVFVPTLDGRGTTRVGLIKNRQKVEIPKSDEDGSSGRKKDRMYIDGLISIELWEELLPYIKDLRERYTPVELKYAFQLRSSYGQKLYDILKTQQFHGHPFVVSMEELRKMLDLSGGEFAKFGDFRRFVLERAQTDINERTDLRFQFEAKKIGKKVQTITFRLSRDRKPKVEFLPATKADDLYRLLTKAGLTVNEAVAAVNRWGTSDPDRIVWHLNETRRKQAAGEIKTAPLAWLRSGLKKDFRPQMRMSFEEKKLEQAEIEVDRRKRTARRPSTGGPLAIGDVIKNAIKQTGSAEAPAASPAENQFVVKDSGNPALDALLRGFQATREKATKAL